MKLVQSKSQPAVTWRRVLKAHNRLFLRWLRESGRAQQKLSEMAEQFAGFLIDSVDRLAGEWPEAPVQLWDRIPEVRSCCSEPATFEKPLAAEAYAYVHLLERYRRTWRTLEHLSDVAALPLGSRGVRTLDIGAGPGPALFAIADFYQALSEFAEEFLVPELKLPPPELAYVEQSPAMVRFIYGFSEYSARRTFGGLMAADFANLDLASKREWHRRQNEVEEYWDAETGEYEEIYDPVSAHAQAERLYRFRLVVLSNFLTLESDVVRFEPEIRALFEDLKPGGVVLVLGATGDSYQKIYDKLSGLALASGLAEGGWHSDDLGEVAPADYAPRIIKSAQHRVYQHLEQLVGFGSLRKEQAWPDYWNPEPSARSRPKFALRVYRSGRWPRIGTAA